MLEFQNSVIAMLETQKTRFLILIWCYSIVKGSKGHFVFKGDLTKTRLR